MTKKILAFGAHPDDVEFGCGGLLIKEIQNGNNVKIVVCSLGEAGTNGTPASRKKEATDSAKFMGAEIEFINLGGDCHIEKNTKNTIKLAEVIRKYKPNVVLATSQTDNQHPDHKNLSDMVRDASRFARYGGLKELTKHKTHNIDGLYYYQSSAEIDAKPDIVVDVTNQYEAWAQSMSMHRSQMKSRGYINLVTSKARAIGASIGVEYATGLWTNDPIRIESFSDFKNSSRNY